jgi:hypothetical protein
MIPATFRDLARAPRQTTRYLLWRVGRRDRPVVDRPVFIVGCPRSGTSLAVELFARHPDVANWSEAGRLWDPEHYSDAEADHCWGEERVTERVARRLHGWCEWYRASRGRSRFVNKHPRNSVRIDFLDRIFPDARFIHVIRDGRAVVNSILTEIRRSPRRQKIPFGGFCKPPDWRRLLREDLVEQTALQWGEIVRYVRARRERLSQRYLEVSYEALCADPRATYKACFAFAGLPVDEAILRGLPEQLDARNQKFRETLSAPEIASIERVEGILLRELGYP